jgi:hypothetical protein
MTRTGSKLGALIGMGAAAGVFGVVAMNFAPAAHADDQSAAITAAVDDILASGHTYFTTAAADFSAGDLANGMAAFFDGTTDDLLGAPDNVIVGFVDELTNEPFQAILDFPTPVPDSFANGLTLAQDFFTAGQADFADAATALTAGEYGLATYDELVGLNITTLLPVEEIILGSLVEIGK